MRLRAKLQKHKEELRKAGALITALFLWVVFLSWEVFVRTYDLYRPFPFVDVPGHFLAGLAIASSFFWVTRHYEIPRPAWSIGIATLLGSLAWELVEEVQEYFITNPPHLIDIFLWDGVADVSITLVGAVVFLTIKYATLK